MSSLRPFEDLAADWQNYVNLLAAGFDGSQAKKLAGITAEDTRRIEHLSRGYWGPEMGRDGRPLPPKPETAAQQQASKGFLIQEDNARKAGRDISTKKQKAAEFALLTAARAGNVKAAQYLRETAGRGIPTTIKEQLAEVDALLSIADAGDYPALYKVQTDLQERVNKEAAEKKRKKLAKMEPAKQIQEMLPEAIGTLADLLSTGTLDQRKFIALAILDRTGFPKTERREFSGQVATGPNLDGLTNEDLEGLLAEARRIKESNADS